MTAMQACLELLGAVGLIIGASFGSTSIPATLRRPFLPPLVWLVLLLSSLPGYAEERMEDKSDAAVSPAETAEVTQRFLLWPLVSFEEGPEWRQFSVRPFYVEREEKDENKKKVQFLWPLYLYRRQDKDVSIRILPLYTYWRDVYEYEDDEESQAQHMLFPIIFAGSSSEYGDYFAVFPVGGKLKHFLGRDEISFILFPLYMSYKKNDLQQRNYVWPVLSFTDGGGYSGFRVWPLYGYFEKENEYHRNFVLWPVYNYQSFDLDTEQPGERLFVFPFYAKEDSARRRYRAVLWPFFTHEQNYAGGFVERASPWPFVVMSRGNIHRTQYWPVYGRKVTADSTSSFVLWPFWFERSYDTPRGTKYQKALMPIYSSGTEFSETNEVLSHKSKIWPLWRFRRYEDGSTDFRMLALLWFDDEQGFERQYAPLWTLYERQTTPEGHTKTYALWRVYRHSRTPTGSESRIPLLFTHRTDAERDFTNMEILGGLFGNYREGDERRLRLLYFLHVVR